MTKTTNSNCTPTTERPLKAPVYPMQEERKIEIVAQYTDDVLAKLTTSFFEVVSKEKWGKRDLSLISGLNETGIGHILSGRRKNLTVETIALLARSMNKRPELILHDTRPSGNRFASAVDALQRTSEPFSTMHGSTAAAALSEERFQPDPFNRSALRSLGEMERRLQQASLME